MEVKEKNRFAFNEHLLTKKYFLKADIIYYLRCNGQFKYGQKKKSPKNFKQ